MRQSMAARNLIFLSWALLGFGQIDDLTASNDRGEFVKRKNEEKESCMEIYPPKLDLKKESIGYYEGSFLYLGIKTEQKK